jgi:hypothetical protein
MKDRFCLPSLLVVGVFIISAVLLAAGATGDPALPVSQSAAASADKPPDSISEFAIPGPLRSFLRMAGVSQQVTPDEVLPSVSWSVVNLGYEGDRPTEFLLLLRRYVVQARELSELAGANQVIHISNCDEARPLLRILGYRVMGQCGQSGAWLLTSDAERAFLTVDSGFPLTDLEQSLGGGKAFEYPYPSSRVPVIFRENDWTIASPKNHLESSKDLIDTILNDRAVARLYWALSKFDSETRDYMQRNIGIRKLLAYGPYLDFYGSHICVRGGRVLVPGGPERESAWQELTGASPASPVDFIPRLVLKDRGWLVAYFDALSMVSQEQQEALTKGERLRAYYSAFRVSDRSLTAATGVFRPAPLLVLLFNQVQWDQNGQPLVPGGLEVWREILTHRKAARALQDKEKKYSLKTPDELLQAMFALSHRDSDPNPVKPYLALVALDSRRSPQNRLSAETVRLMTLKYNLYSDQYRIFCEFPELSDASISLFLDTADHLGKTPNQVRANAFGMMQASIGLWQILARQGQIPPAQLDDSWQNVLKSFSHVHSASEIYDAGRASLSELSRTTTGKTTISQDELIELLAGPRQSTADGKKVHTEIADRIRSVLDGQRLVSLDTLISLGDALAAKANGTAPDDYVFTLAGELHEFEMPQPMFSKSEREEWAARVYNNNHTDQEMRSNVGTVLKSTKASHNQIEDARGELTSFLRDTLVGLNYAYYEPPGAQALHNNPLFVRNHDFAGETVEGISALWQSPQLFGAGYPAGGGAHLVGSLADLPYVLAELEQDFIAPRNVQALIWKELVPSLLTSAVLPRWWDVTPHEMHAVALYQQAGEELVTASVGDEALRSKVLSVLAERLPPRRAEQIEQALRQRRTHDMIAMLLPADTFYLMQEFEHRYPNAAPNFSKAAKELASLRQQDPQDVNWTRLSRDFGVPHPTLRDTYGCALLNVPPLPAFSGYASRLLGESWDSSNLYWARLADESGRSPVELNLLVPELTQHMVEKTFATDLEDWPAILRAMRETGEEFRQGKIAALPELHEPQPSNAQVSKTE